MGQRARIAVALGLTGALAFLGVGELGAMSLVDLRGEYWITGCFAGVPVVLELRPSLVLSASLLSAFLLYAIVRKQLKAANR